MPEHIANFIVFTDGASRGNPGPGGWGAILVENKNLKIKDKDTIQIKELGGREEHTTNNRMELRAAIEALAKIPERAEVKIYTDSSYLINGITKWVKAWKKIGWVTRAKEEVLNRDLWEKLDLLTEKREISWEYVGGHVGIKGNERCDQIATAFADGRKIDLFAGLFHDYAIKNVLDVQAAKIKKESKSRRDAKAYSYISMVKGDIKIHHSWPECEKRVKGVSGARYKKALNAEDEENIIRSFNI